MTDRIVYSSQLFQVIRRTQRNTFEVDGKETQKEVTYELVRRPPGVRAIIVENEKLLLNREYRFELNDWDYRLPGGKVFDDAVSYQEAIHAGQVDAAIISQLKNEVREEADIEVQSYRLLKKSTCGFTVEWDLYYFLVDQFQILPSFASADSQKSEYEFIQHVWVPFQEALQLCAANKVSEDRSASVLMRFLLTHLSAK